MRKLCEKYLCVLHLFERKSRAGFRGTTTQASAQSPKLCLHSVVDIMNGYFLNQVPGTLITLQEASQQITQPILSEGLVLTSLWLLLRVSTCEHVNMLSCVPVQNDRKEQHSSKPSGHCATRTFFKARNLDADSLSRDQPSRTAHQISKYTPKCYL